MRRTRKRGGSSNPDQEKQEISQLIRDVEDPRLNNQQTLEKAKELFRTILGSSHYIKSRANRFDINLLARRFFGGYGPSDPELNNLIRQVNDRMHAIPAAELTAGRRIKRKTHKARKNYRK